MLYCIYKSPWGRGLSYCYRQGEKNVSIIAKLTEKKDFSVLESKIADYILENKKEILHYTIRELAKETYTGASTVMRVIKKVYTGSFSDFKVDLAYELQNAVSKENNKVLFQIKKQETAFSIMEKIASVEKDTIDRTKLLLDYQQIERVTKLINKATIIYVFADGINEQIGYEFKYMMARIGKAVEIAADNFWVALNCLSETANPLAVYINHREHNVQLLEKVKLNHKIAIPGIAITGYVNPTLETCCRELIIIPTGVSYSDLAPVIYTTAIRYVLNIIVGCIIASNHQTSMDKLIDYTELAQNVK